MPTIEETPLINSDDVALKSFAPSSSNKSTAHLTTTTIAVEGMTCGACTAAIESGFKDVKGVQSVSVSLILNRAVVLHDSSIIKAEDVVEV